ncbi:helix-turn-helix domain-containing protein [Cognataquiflexum aquatile]|uniref:helix-turn-helix domain-containing protein n=1 Tax=Cognataquiflexum aquatile TaxID=2249427 RepID=UPI000DE9C457|nr:helix-turn-helix domain-containing protein [Cognataquiflexum aquatile]
MEVILDFNALIHLAAAILGILSGFIILYFGIKSNPKNQPLAIFQIIASIAIFVNFSLISELIFYWPFMYRMGHICILIFLPMPFLFVVFHTRNRLWKWYDLLHALPLLVFFIDYGHVLLMSNAEKILILQKEVNDLDLLGKFAQSKYIGPNFHENFRSFLFSFYWIAQFYLFLKWSKAQKAMAKQTKIWKNWTMFFLSFQFFMFVPFYLSFFGLDSLTSYHMTNSFVVIWLLLSSVSLFFFPSLLYGFTIKPEKETPKIKKQIETKVGEDQKSDDVILAIEQQMDERKLFLTMGYSINDFSRDINIPVYQISKTLNTFKGMGFVDYINQKRILYCVSKFGKGEWLMYTSEAIAAECGFSNRNTFTRAFKKFQGIYPSEFKKKLNS